MIICPNCSAGHVSRSDGRCPDCGWQRGDRQGVPDYLSETDRSSGLVAEYANTYENLAQQNLGKSNIDRQFLRNQAKNLVRYVAPVEGLYVCDVGIGQGFLCKELLASGVKRIAAVDLAVSYLREFAGHAQVDTYLANAEALPFRDEFDFLVATDVMEHVINVGSFLYCVNRAVKLGGRAAIRVPYREGLLAYSPHKGYEHAFGHLRSFNRDILKLYFEEAGFRLTDFHLDGFSLGMPQPYLYDKGWKKRLYQRFHDLASRFVSDPADVARWNGWLARLAMRPVEIVAVGTKVRALA